MAFPTHFFGLVLTLSMLVLVTVPAPPPPGGYRMVLFWPPGFCYTLGDICNTGQVSDDTFTAHGLWPCMANGGSVPPRWEIEPWASKFTTIPLTQQRKLTRYWKNYKKWDKRNVWKIWKYQWDKHGENGHFSQYDYFNRVADLTQEYGKRLVQILAEKGSIPKRIEEGGYQVAHIETALFQGLGNIKPEVVCKKNDNAPSIYVLEEIRLMMDSAAKQLRNATSQKCKEQVVYFPSTESLFRHTEL